MVYTDYGPAPRGDETRHARHSPLPPPRPATPTRAEQVQPEQRAPLHRLVPVSSKAPAAPAPVAPAPAAVPVAAACRDDSPVALDVSVTDEPAIEGSMPFRILGRIVGAVARVEEKAADKVRAQPAVYCDRSSSSGGPRAAHHTRAARPRRQDHDKRAVRTSAYVSIDRRHGVRYTGDGGFALVPSGNPDAPR